jgi:alanine dehydrogenase
VADRIVLDTRRLLHESGDALAAREAGTIDETNICELSAVVAGTTPGRTDAHQVTLYKSVGTGLQDVAAAYRIYQTARERKLGAEAADFTTPRVMATRQPPVVA